MIIPNAGAWKRTSDVQIRHPENESNFEMARISAGLIRTALPEIKHYI